MISTAYGGFVLCILWYVEVELYVMKLQRQGSMPDSM
jgi:hypothetical protein